MLGLGGESLRWIRVLAACSCTAVQGCSTVLQCCSTGYSLQCNNGSSDLNTSLLLVTFYILLSNTLRVGSPNCCPTRQRKTLNHHFLLMLETEAANCGEGHQIKKGVAERREAE